MVSVPTENRAGRPDGRCVGLDVSVSSPLCLSGFVAVAVACMALLGALSVWVVPASAGDCPNEQVRLEDHSAQLPDCRAFELVSPPYKDGYEPFIKAASPDGERVLLDSIGTFAGAKGNHVLEGTMYESFRTSSGWQARAITPPASVLDFAEWMDASPDLGRTLWVAHTVSQSADAVDLYVREPDGSFVLVGPEVPPSDETAPPAPKTTSNVDNLKYMGASPDLSHVFFEIQPGEGEEDLEWEGDTTLPGGNARSLYEYSGVGNSEPKLVGVKNEGRLESNAKAEMISQCGEELGGGRDPGFASMYNAISSSGATVFFTADRGGCENEREEIGSGPGVNEVYARVHESETVAISEPSNEDCATCDTSSRTRAFFEGASQDGSKAFFLSEQNGLLPGAEGMNLYEYDFNGAEHEKLVRVSGGVSEPKIQGVARISEDGSHVYFVAGGVLANNKNTNGEEAKADSDNLYVFDSVTGAISFIGVLLSEDELDWQIQDERPVQATPDGRFVVFASRAHLTPDDDSGPNVAQLFEYDAETGELARVSVGQRGSHLCSATGKTEEGYNCNGNTENRTYAPAIAEPSLAVRALAFVNNLDVSANGSVILFASNNPLAPQAINSLSGELCQNVYEYRWSEKEGGMTQGNVSLVSDGQDVTASGTICGSGLDGEDLSGADVMVESTDRLVSQDTDTQRDIYDAREDGGFPAGVSPPGCVGDGCQGSLSIGPQLFGAGSATQSGGGNVVPSVSSPVIKPKPKSKGAKCRRGDVKRKGRCVVARKPRASKRAAKSRIRGGKK